MNNVMDDMEENETGNLTAAEKKAKKIQKVEKMMEINLESQ